MQQRLNRRWYANRRRIESTPPYRSSGRPSHPDFRRETGPSATTRIREPGSRYSRSVNNPDTRYCAVDGVDYARLVRLSSNLSVSSIHVFFFINKILTRIMKIIRKIFFSTARKFGSRLKTQDVVFSSYPANPRLIHRKSRVGALATRCWRRGHHDERRRKKPSQRTATRGI